MKTLASKSYTVAWFKLADFIARGEKERALHMYPLLMYSIPDPAIAYQLEGDILLSFDDRGALEKYRQAVKLYKKSGKIKQALGIYQHANLFLQEEIVIKDLLELYALDNDMIQFKKTVESLFALYKDSNPKELAISVEKSKKYLPSKYHLIISALCLQFSISKNDITETVYVKIEVILDLFMNLLPSDQDIEYEFNLFLANLKVVPGIDFSRLEQYLKNVKL